MRFTVADGVVLAGSVLALSLALNGAASSSVTPQQVTPVVYHATMDRPLPRWFHWGGTDARRGPKGRRGPCIIVWGGQQDGALICRDARAGHE